jgi:hypothetical protein
MCETMLATILSCRCKDVKFMLEKVNNWGSDIEGVILDIKSYTEVTFDELIYLIFEYHSIDIKGWIIDILYENNIKFDNEILEGYEIEIYVNYLDTFYDDKYQFWDVANMDELMQELDKIVDFLINENIVENETKFTLKEKLNNI